MSALLDAIGQVGYALDTPGAYTRGLLAGRPGERASGREMLESWGVLGRNTPGLDWGDAAGFAADAVIDPLSLLGPVMGAYRGINAATDAARAVSRADDASPLLRAMGRFVGDEAGHVDLDLARRLVEERRGPLGRMAGMVDQAPVELTLDAESLGRTFGYPGRGTRTLAEYQPGFSQFSSRGPIQVPAELLPNLNVDAWGDDAAMRALLREGYTLPSSIPRSAYPAYVGVHETGHVYHNPLVKAATRHDALNDITYPVDNVWQLLPTNAGWERHGGMGLQSTWHMPEALDRSITASLGKYATTNPDEFVAEAFARKVLGRKALPRSLDDLYTALRGPDPGQLPPSFWEAIR